MLPIFFLSVWLFWKLIQGTKLACKKPLPSENQHLLTGLIRSSEEVILVQLKCLEWDFSKLFCLLGTEGMEINCKNICKVLEDLGFWCRNWQNCIWLCVWGPQNYLGCQCCCFSWFLEMWSLTRCAPDCFWSSHVNFVLCQWGCGRLGKSYVQRVSSYLCCPWFWLPQRICA